MSVNADLEGKVECTTRTSKFNQNRRDAITRIATSTFTIFANTLHDVELKLMVV